MPIAVHDLWPIQSINGWTQSLSMPFDSSMDVIGFVQAFSPKTMLAQLEMTCHQAVLSLEDPKGLCHIQVPMVQVPFLTPGRPQQFCAVMGPLNRIVHVGKRWIAKVTFHDLPESPWDSFEGEAEWRLLVVSRVPKMFPRAGRDM